VAPNYVKLKNNRSFYYYLIIICTFCVSFFHIYARSPFRPDDPTAPLIIARWQHDAQCHYLKNPHLREGPYFNLFDKDHFYAHLLPSASISYRHDPTKTVSGDILSARIENLLSEVQQGKPRYTHFTILKQRDFNSRDKTGLIIAKFNDFPFVVKLFIETPQSFVDPLSKGFETSGLFVLGGGITRHLSGFTRIKNLEKVHARIQECPYWSFRVSFPRKWFWLPENSQWIEVSSQHLGPEGHRSVVIPAIYAIVCDYIDVERVFSLKNQNDRRIAMNLSNYLHQHIDPHINNYAIEKKTHFIVPLDTEHFPTMVGYEDPPHCKSYLQWYSHLAFKIVFDSLGHSKPMRKEKQRKRHWPMEPF
jgi:hypothetical protein